MGGGGTAPARRRARGKAMTRLNSPIWRALRRAGAVLALAAAAGAVADAQRRPARRTEPAAITCPAEVGVGMTTERRFCDVLTGRDPADGILIKIPPHRGAVTLLFDLHNRHTYSAELEQAGRAYASYTAVVGVLTMNNDLVGRAVVQSEFRSSRDLFDRIRGGAGPTGLKAVAPLGDEPITVNLPDDATEVSLLGERLTVRRLDGEFSYASSGQAVALVSNIRVDYQPRR